MVTIIFESHATTHDNEAHIASGWYDIELSKLGEEQAAELGKRYADKRFDAIFCSDLQRSYKTAEIAFGDKYPIIKDQRLRECNYGDLTKASAHTIQELKESAIESPFPNGESFLDTSARMRNFLKDLLQSHEGKEVMIIGHRATQYGLEEHVKGVKLQEAVSSPWKWQPGWIYQFSAIK